MEMLFQVDHALLEYFLIFIIVSSSSIANWDIIIDPKALLLLHRKVNKCPSSNGNVLVAFPSNNEYSVTFPLKTGDECLVFFSDLSIDNFWEKGDVQNPIEDRRHDLSDGIAYPCNLSLVKRRRTKDGLLLSSVNSGVLVKNSSVEVYTNGAKINISTSDIEFSCSAGTINVSDIIRHTHTAPPTGGETSKPNY